MNIIYKLHPICMVMDPDFFCSVHMTSERIFILHPVRPFFIHLNILIEPLDLYIEVGYSYCPVAL